MEHGIKYLKWFYSHKDKITDYLSVSMGDVNYFKRLMENIETFDENVHKKSKEEQRKSSLEYMVNLYNIIMATTTLDNLIGTLLMRHIATIDSPSMKKVVEAEKYPSSVKKLQFLRIADILSEQDYVNLRTLYDIRNEFARVSLALLDTTKTFDLLNNIKVDDQKINQMPINVNRYYEIAIFYAVRLKKILDEYKTKNKVDG